MSHNMVHLKSKESISLHLSRKLTCVHTPETGRYSRPSCSSFQLVPLDSRRLGWYLDHASRCSEKQGRVVVVAWRQISPYKSWCADPGDALFLWHGWSINVSYVSRVEIHWKAGDIAGYQRVRVLMKKEMLRVIWYCDRVRSDMAKVRLSLIARSKEIS